MWIVLRHSCYTMYEEESIPLSFRQILLDILSEILITNSRNSSTFKAFLAPIHERVYSAKLERNWNASMCVEK